MWTNAFALRPIWHYASAIFYSTFKNIKFVTRGWIFPCYKNFQCSTLCSLPFDSTTSKPIPCIFPHYTCICEQDPSAPLMCSLYSPLTSQSIPPLWYWDSHMLFLSLPGEEVTVKAKDKHCLWHFCRIANQGRSISFKILILSGPFLLAQWVQENLGF